MGIDEYVSLWQVILNSVRNKLQHLGMNWDFIGLSPPSLPFFPVNTI